MNVLDVKRAGFDYSVNTSGVASTSRGLVGDTVFAVIPNVQPSFTFIITIAFQAASPFTFLLQCRSSSVCIADILNQTLENTNLQVILDLFDPLRLRLVHVWLACARESRFARPCATYVSCFLRFYRCL